MAQSVFGATINTPKVIKAGKCIVVVNGKDLIALNVQINFSRQVEVIPVLGKKRVVSIGEPQGTFSAETLLAKGEDAFSAFNLSGADCIPFDMKIRLDGKDACDLDGKTVTAKNCFSSGVSITAQGGRGWVGQGVQVTFTALEIG